MLIYFQLVKVQLVKVSRSQTLDLRLCFRDLMMCLNNLPSLRILF